MSSLCALLVNQFLQARWWINPLFNVAALGTDMPHHCDRAQDANLHKASRLDATMLQLEDFGTAALGAFVFPFHKRARLRRTLRVSSGYRTPIIRVAEGERFELSLGLPLSLISSQVPSTTQPPFHTFMSNQ